MMETFVFDFSWWQSKVSARRLEITAPPDPPAQLDHRGPRGYGGEMDPRVSEETGDSLEKVVPEARRDFQETRDFGDPKERWGGQVRSYEMFTGKLNALGINSYILISVLITVRPLDFGRNLILHVAVSLTFSFITQYHIPSVLKSSNSCTLIIP